MEMQRRVRRKKHRRVALDSDEDEDEDDAFAQHEQHARRASVAPRRTKHSRRAADECDDEEFDSGVTIEPLVVYSPSSSRRDRESKQRSKQHRGTSNSKKTSRRSLTVAFADPPAAAAAVSAASGSPAMSFLAAQAPRVLAVTLTIGDWLDVLDYVGVWNVAQVLSIPSNDTVEVRYDGWGVRYNEVVPLNSSRVAPFHTFTWSVKCWAKYLNWPMWPAIMTVRTPGTPAGAKNLRTVNRVYVDYVDSKKFATRCRCWANKRDVVSFEENFERLRKHTNGADFEFSLKHVLKSTATTKFPTFVQGTLPKQHEAGVTLPVRKMKKAMGNALWIKDFANNRERHNRMHGCEGALLGTRDSIDEVSIILDLQEELVRQLKERKTSKSSLRTPIRRSSQDADAPRSPFSAKRASPRASPRSPRVVTEPAPALILSRNVIFNHDDIIVEDDEEEEEVEHKRLKRIQRRKRQRVANSKPGTPKKRRPSSSSSEEEDSEDSDSESDESADPPPPRRVASAAREIAAKERHGLRIEKRSLSRTPPPPPPAKAQRKRPRATRSLWLERIKDSLALVKKEPPSAQASARRSNGGSSTVGGEASEKASDSDDDNDDDDDGDGDWGFTTEDNSEERLLDADGNLVLVPVQVVPALSPSPISVLDIEDAEMVEVKPAASSWSVKQEQSVAATDSEPPVKVGGEVKAKKPPSRKSLSSAKRKPSRTLMDTRMEVVQAALDALEEEEKKRKEGSVSSAAERRTLSNLRRLKVVTDCGGNNSSNPVAFPGLSDSVEAGKKSSGSGSSTSESSSRSGKRKSTLEHDPSAAKATTLSENHSPSEQKEPENGDERDDGMDGDDVEPQLRRRFCMMRASTRAGESRTTQQKVRAFQTSKSESQTVVRAPNMFPDPPLQRQQQPQLAPMSSLSEIPLLVFSSNGLFTHSMLRIADSTALTTATPGGSDGEQPVFNSSAEFSISSWFKQALG